MPGENGLLGDAQVVEQITKQIEKIGATTTERLNEVQSNFSKLQEVVNKGLPDQMDKNMAAKFALAAATQQDLIDKAFAKQTAEQKTLEKKLIDLETLINRGQFGGNGTEAKELEKNLRQFTSENLSARNKGATFEEVEAKPYSMETFTQYVKTWEKLMIKGKDALNMEEIKTLSIGIDPHGGYTTYPTLSSKIIQRMFETDPIRQLASVESITTPELEFFVDVNQATCGWEGETVAGGETDTPDIGMKKIQVFTMYAKPRASQNSLEDSAWNLESWLGKKVGERIGRTEEAAFVSGDGIKKPRGFLTYASGTTDVTVEQINMGAAAALTADGFINIKYHLVEQYLNSGTWLMNRLTLAACMMLKYGSGEYIWKPGFQTDPNSTILGLPVRMSTTMPQVAANALAVVLADFREAYQIVDRLGITVQRDPYTVKPLVEFYTRKRVGGDLINGQAMKIGVIHV